MCAQVESEVTELILGRDNDPSKRRSERGGVHGGVQATRFRTPRRASMAGGRGRGPERAPRGGYGRLPWTLLGGAASGAQWRGWGGRGNRHMYSIARCGACLVVYVRSLVGARSHWACNTSLLRPIWWYIFRVGQDLHTRREEREANLLRCCNHHNPFSAFTHFENLGPQAIPSSC